MYAFTVDCTFKVTNLEFQGYSIISLIIVDALASILFTSFMYRKGKLKEFYDYEKINWLTRTILYMGFQITFELWVAHFSSYKLLLQE